MVEIFDTGYGNRRYSEVLAVFIKVKNFSRLTDTPTNHFKVTNFLFAPKGPKGPKMVLKSTLIYSDDITKRVNDMQLPQKHKSIIG